MVDLRNLTPIGPRRKLPIHDKNGIVISVGDIIAEGYIGETIWNGTGTIISRPLGIVYETNSATRKRYDEDRFFGVFEIVAGTATIKEGLTDKDPISHFISKSTQVFHLSNEYNEYMGWKDCEVIGTVYNLDKILKEYYDNKLNNK